ncbi:MAG TPA: YggT family protein [Pyrinomonadaceae bacterium]|jgi:YggT family protein|nr:YggT family protein [Pyrinomonadaceae bacterium]
MNPFEAISQVCTAIVQILIGLVTVLMVLRLIMNFADVNPFGRIAITLRRLSDPLVNPARRVLAGFGVDQKFAPALTLLIAILLGFFALELINSVLFGIRGAVISAQERNPAQVLGFILYSALQIYSLLLFIRIVFSWGMVSSVNPVMRFLMKATDPLLVPLRRIVPPLGMFDLSPLVAFMIIWLFMKAIEGTLLRNAGAG